MIDLKRIFCIVAVLFAVAAASLADSSTDSPGNKRDDRVTYLLGLMDQQRYAETAQGVQQLFIDYPDDAGSYEIRALLEMHVGAFHAARRDFQFASSLADGSDPVPSYALGLCCIALHDYDAADTYLIAAEALASPTERGDVHFAEAILAIARGDYADAEISANGINTPAATELAALIAYHKSTVSGTAAIEAFLDSAKTNGLPRVVEEAGLRVLGPSPRDGSITIEPALTEPAMQAMFDDRLAYQNAPMSAQESDVVMGAISLRPTADPVMDSKTSIVVTATVDGQLIGLVNNPPYQIDWDTRKTPNGIHTVKLDLAESDGTVFATQTRKYKIANPGSALAHPTLPFSQSVVDQIWSKLQLHPAYKTAEFTLATEYFARKDRSKGIAHLLITAALDSDYYNVGALVKDVFRGNPSEMNKVASNRITSVSPASNTPIEFWRGSPNIHEMALTFDDGPNPTQTPKLLDALTKANVVGTFFVVGIRASAAPDIITRMVADGHEVENHTYTHPNLDEVIPEHIREEYLRNGVVINTLTGRWPRFLRPPGGNSNPYVMQVAMECGMVGGFWTLDALGQEDTGNGQNVTDYVVGHAKDGAIVLMHNGTQATIDAIPSMVAGLRAKGFRLVTIAQLARDDGINVR